MERVKHPSLAAALCAVMGEVPYVQKTGRNEFHRYKYASDADLLAALQPAMAKHGVAWLLERVEPVYAEGPQDRKGKGQRYTDLVVTYRVAHADSDQTLTVQSVGTGLDGEDKGGYKALTGALKYALRQTFLLPTGDDPEKDEDAPEPQRRRAPPKVQVTGTPLPDPSTTPHDPTWDAAKGAFFAALQGTGWTYEALAEFSTAKTGLRPSQLPPERRAKLLEYVNSNPKE